MSKNITTRLLLAAAFGAALLGPAPSFAQAAAGAYPSQPLTFILPFAAGGPSDAVARMVARELSAAWGVPVVVDNRAGASGIIGSSAVARAPHDGYTVLFTNTSHVQLPAMKRNVPYDALKDFLPITQVGLVTTVLAVTDDFPAANFQEFVQKVKATPGKYAYGSAGAGTTSHIFGELLKKQAGLDMTHVAYKGGAPMMADMLGRHIQLSLMDITTGKPHLAAGKIRALAVLGPQRSAQLPQVPTFQEMGLADFDPSLWVATFVPAGTPIDRVEKLSTAVQAILRKPEVQKTMRELNIEPVGNTPAQFDAILRREAETWKRIMERTGIRLED
jgi:tripartite-type tricarboxylate transporter receptor subunit TctC